ncbi:DUF1648 domain-containing protein [Xylanimonas sp. McL0601]|uniref:DUF1648 domain-containing protein n=1 Tax=Xylanimonas sp. McL0601 TaxID=3414739 RepID=UPI003CEAEC98
MTYRSPATSGTTAAWKPRAHRAALWSGGAALALLLVAAAVVLSWRSQLPDPIASHWAADGRPDGFSSLGGFVAVLLITGVVCILAFSALCWFWGQASMTRRIVAASSVWIGAFLAMLTVGSLWNQRGLTDAAQATNSSGLVALAVLVPLVPAALVALLLPGDPPLAATTPVRADAARVPLAPQERAVWLRRVHGGPGIVVGVVAIAVTAAIAVLTQLWALLMVPVLLAVLFACFFEFEVRVDASGLRVRSGLGWPRTFIPADEVLAASKVDVNPFTEFGGWGWRVGRHGRVGIVPRGGEALLVERSGERSLVVTIDDAAAGAALLNTMADRAQAR